MKSILLSASLLCVLLLSACGAEQSVQPEAPVEPPTVIQPEILPQPSTPPAEPPAPEDPAAEISPAVSVEFVIERFLAQRDNYAYFDDAPHSEYPTKLAFFAEETLSDFCYLSITPDVKEDGQILCTEQETLYTIERFTPNDLLVINLEFEGLLPQRAISYLDESGTAHLEYLALSGEDNIPLLGPLFPA